MDPRISWYYWVPCWFIITHVVVPTNPINRESIIVSMWYVWRIPVESIPIVTMAGKGTKVMVLFQVIHSITVESYYVRPPIIRIVRTFQTLGFTSDKIVFRHVPERYSRSKSTPSLFELAPQIYDHFVIVSNVLWWRRRRRWVSIESFPLKVWFWKCPKGRAKWYPKGLVFREFIPKKSDRWNQNHRFKL
jgi:hypothetical protein